MFLCIGFGSVKADELNIHFDQLDSLARMESPRSKIIEHEYQKSLAERDENLQWNNPELAYDIEKVDVSEEFQVTFGKQFALPWAHLSRRSAWNQRINSADLYRKSLMVDHVAEMKTGYVKVRINQQYLARLKQLHTILTEISHVAASRHTEGHISGIEEHLIKMALISLNANYHDAMQRRHEAMASWRTALGYSAEDSLILSTDIEYNKIELQPASHYIAVAEFQPGVQARQIMHQALSKQASAARASFIPSFNLYGGYKKIEPDYDGYVAGVSLSIPLFNRNSAAARKYRAESNIAAQEASLYRGQVEGKIRILTRSIEESQKILTTVANHPEEDIEFLNTLLQSYEEGWLTLSELLSAIQIETAGFEDYYDLLIKYYENLFELEALTGEKLITF
jgi:outer membrane protein TolC